MRWHAFLNVSVLAVLVSSGTWAQGVECEASDGRRLFVAGASACPFGLALVGRSGPISPQKAAFLAKGVQEITAVQEALAKLGFLKGNPDGLFGPATEAAITAWQKSQGLPETGVLPDEQIAALKTAAVPIAAPTEPQSFKCAPRGTVLVFATIATPVTVLGEKISLGQEDLSCFYFVRSQAEGSYADTQFFAGFWRAITPEEQELLLRLGPGQLWPMSVGKSLERDIRDGEAASRIRVQVDRYEAADTPLGRIPAYVVTVTEMAGNPLKEGLVNTYWWSPDLGETIRFESRDGSGTTTGWQLLGVSR